MAERDQQDTVRIDDDDHTPRPHGRLTGASISAVHDSLVEDGVLFRLDDEGIARHFTKPFFDGNPWEASLTDLRDAVAKLDGCPDDIPADPAEFPRWVRKELLDFDHLPRDKLAELHGWASRDLALIGSHIKDCTGSIIELERRSPKSDSDELDIRFLRYYLKLNEQAKEEIVSVLADGVEREAVRSAFRRYFRMIDFHVPWSFRWHPERFAHANYSPVRHAFLNLPISQLREVEHLYAEQRWTEFDRRLDEYIDHEQVIVGIRGMLDAHHLLKARGDVVRPALEAYERGELALFASAIAMQIEGAFEDACHLARVSPTELRNATLVPKLDALLRKHDLRIDYPYYAFKFPIVRNQLAHGRVFKDGLGRLARLLLLDLYDACRVVRDHPAGVNTMVVLLRGLSPDAATVEEAVTFATLFAETNGDPPDAFYGLGDKFDSMRLVIEREQVWAFLRALEREHVDEIDAGLAFLAKGLLRLRPALRKESSDMLAALGESRGRDAFDRDEFWAAVQRCKGFDALANPGDHRG